MNNYQQRHSGGRVTKWKGKVASIAPALMLGSVSIIALSSPGVSAPYGDVDITIAANNPITENPVSTAIIDINVADYTKTLTVDGNLTGVGNGSAIDFQADLSGTATVNGDLSMSATGTAIGVDVQGDVKGTLTNTGTITMDVSHSASSSAYAAGLRAANVSGSLTNSGSLSILSSSTFSATASGIYVETVNAGGTVNNSGSIAVGASASSSANAAGLKFTTIDGAVQNSGEIIVGALASFASATGIRATTLSATGSLTNSGNIAVAASGSTASAYGIRISGATDGQFSNTGNIIAVGLASSHASATGIRLSNVGDTSTVTNTGDIIVGALGSSATSYGIRTGHTDGTFKNTGSLQVGAGGPSFGSAYGLRLDQIGLNSRSASVENTGDITVYAGGSSRAYGYGIQFNHVHGTSTVKNTGNVLITLTGDMEGSATAISGRSLQDSSSFTNTGDITITGTTKNPTSATCTAPSTRFCKGNLGGTGIYFGGTFVFTPRGFSIQAVEAGASFSNTGDITLSLASQGLADVYAQGLYVADTLGTFKNSGDITINASAQSGTANATGLNLGYMRTGASGENSGNIAISVSAVTSEVSASGLYLQGVETGASFVNTGNITINSISTSSSASGTGIGAGDVAQGGTFSNSGNITIKVDAGATAGAEGLYLSDIGGTATNSGNISVDIKAGASSASATGIYIRNISSTGVVENSGSISISASAATSSAAVEGISVVFLDGMMTNSGDITVSATGNTSASARGMDLSFFSGTFNSNGNISVTANGSSGASSVQAFGIRSASFTGTLNVTGDILVSGNGTNYGIYLGTGSGTLNLESSANIDGTIRVADHTVNMTHVGEAAVYRFEDANIDPSTGGGFATATSNANWIWVTSAEGTAAPTYAAVNTTDFSSGTSTTQLAGVIGDTLAAELAELSTGETTRLDLTASAQRIQGYAGASLSTFKSASTDVNMGLIQGGSMMTSQSGNRFGLGLSVIDYNGRDGSTDLDARGAALSATYLASLGGMDLGFGLSYGAVQTDSARTVGGSPDALASFGSDFATASFSASREFDVGGEGVLTGFGKALVGQQKVDGYTETGSLANATVGAQTVNFHQYSLGAEYRVPQPDGVFTATVEAVRTESSNAGGFQLSVLGSGLTGGATSVSDTYAKVSFGLDQDMANGGLLSLGMATTFFGDTAQQSVSAKYTFDF